MVHLKSIFGIRDKKIGLIFVREQGLDLEVWDGRPYPCWSIGILRTDADNRKSDEVVCIPDVRRWLLVLPTYLSTTRCIRLPLSRPEEIAAMLEFEIPQIVPCSTQSWTWDFYIMNWERDGTSQVLVVLSPLSAVESAIDQLNALGIEPDLVTVSAALHAVSPIQGKNEEKRLCGHVWWDQDYLDFSAIYDSRLVFLRGVRVSGENSQALGFVEAEINRSLSMIKERDICDGELSVRIGGTNPEVPRLVERLGQSEFIRASKEFDLAQHDATQVESGAVGRIIWESWCRRRARPACINLLPKNRKEKDRRAHHRREILRVALAACLIALLMLLCLRISVWRKTRLLSQYQQRLATIAPLAQKLQFLEGQLNMIQRQIQGSVSMLDIIGQLYEVLPQEVTVHYLNIDQDRQVVVRAQAKRLSQAFDCIDPLERSPYLVNVRQSYAHLRELEGQVLIDFELRADLERHSTMEAGQ